MGGGHYDGDVARQSRSTNQDVFSFRGYSATGDAANRTTHPELNPFGKIREVNNQTPIVVAMDVTRSRGDDTKIIYAKLPMFLGQIELNNYVQGPAISFCAIGDATSGDEAPLQCGQFEADNRLDRVLSLIWIEEGGGGSGQESYELAAYFYARHTKCVQWEQTGKKGYFFFLGDEGFYPNVAKSQIKKVLGRDVAADVDSKTAFKELQEKFEVFFIYPQKSMAERKKDIDAEIRQRVLAAGGRYEGVDIRASLLWNNRNDLDLHVIPPSGEHIFYGHKQSQCGGWLDVDMNVRGETTKPVENVQWRRGTAPAGKYKVFVQNYGFHEDTHGPTSFRVELEVNGETQHFEHTIKAGLSGPSSDVTVFEFTYDPAKRPADAEADKQYEGYSDEVILRQWGEVLPASHILQIEDPKSIIDLMLGALAIKGAGKDLAGYLDDMKRRDQTDLRVDQATRTLGNLATSARTQAAAVSGDLPAGGGAKRGGKSTRL
jgi:hypothetical protein